MSLKVMYSCSLTGQDIDTSIFINHSSIEVEEVDIIKGKSYILFSNYQGDFGSHVAFDKFLDLLLVKDIKKKS